MGGGGTATNACSSVYAKLWVVVTTWQRGDAQQNATLEGYARHDAEQPPSHTKANAPFDLWCCIQQDWQRVPDRSVCTAVHPHHSHTQRLSMLEMHCSVSRHAHATTDTNVCYAMPHQMYRRVLGKYHW